MQSLTRISEDHFRHATGRLDVSTNDLRSGARRAELKLRHLANLKQIDSRCLWTESAPNRDLWTQGALEHLQRPQEVAGEHFVDVGENADI